MQSNQDGQGFEDNLALWNIIRLDIDDENNSSYEPCDAILKIREICHFARPKLEEVSILSLNDSIDSKR